MLRKLSFALAVVALSTQASSQCLTGPDNLSGPCCTPATPNLPTFPSATLPATGICWQACVPQQVCARVVLGAPQMTVCGQYQASVQVFDCNGLATIGGVMTLDYTRTWEEASANPQVKLQVYRFVAKVDLTLTAAGGAGCPVPACLPALPTAFFYGYVDYALDCTGVGTEQVSLVLFHNCDAFIHHPLSTTPGAFHPGMSYAVVAPSTAANPFVAGTLIPPGGSLVAEATRQVPGTPGAPCVTEDPISGGHLQVLGSGCVCSPVPVAQPQVTARRLFGKGTCLSPTGIPTSFQTVKAFPSLPWFHMMTMAIGTWTTGASYPGPEAAWVDEAAIFYKDTCSLTGAPAQGYGEVYYGASTSGGYQVVSQPTGPPLTQNFTDLASNTSWTVPGPPPSTFMGNVLPTRHLIYVNVP